MKYYDIQWTGKDDIDDKIRSAFIHIKLEINIAYKKETIRNKYNMPRSFWFIKKEEKIFNKILESYPDVFEYFKEKIAI